MSQFMLLPEVERLAYEALVNPPQGIPLPWWKRFSELIGGLRMNEFSVITAQTGAGKTTLLANLVCQALIQAIGVYVCSAEIGNAMFLIAMYSALEQKRLGGGEKLDAAYVSRMQEVHAQNLRSGRLLFSKHDDRIAPEVLMKELEDAAEFGAKLFILDNLQFFTPIVDSTRAMAAADTVTREFARLVRRKAIHCILIAHPKKGELVSEDSIKGSSTLGQEADNIILMHRLSDEEMSTNSFMPTDRKIEFRKIRRRGWNYGKCIYFTYDGGTYMEKNVVYSS